MEENFFLVLEGGGSIREKKIAMTLNDSFLLRHEPNVDNYTKLQSFFFFYNLIEKKFVLVTKYFSK